MLDWERAGETIEVTVLNGELLGKDLVFAQVYGTVENYVNLGADFEPGRTYTVLVNDVTETFVAQ